MDLTQNILTVFEEDALFGDITLDEVIALQDHMRQRQQQRRGLPPIKSAIVAISPALLAMMKLHELSFADDVEGAERVFETEADALHWFSEIDGSGP